MPVRGPPVMPAITIVTHQAGATAESMSRITDLAIVTTQAGPVLYATTRHDGAVSAWNIAGGGVAAIASAAHGLPVVAGGAPGLGFVGMGAGLGLLTGGGHDSALILRPLTGSGGFGAAANLGTLPGFGGDLVHTVTVDLGGGVQGVYGGFAGAAGLGLLRFDAGGALRGSGTTADTAATHAGAVTALATARLGGVAYVFSADAEDPGVTAWRVGANGALTAVANLGNDGGLWISAPTALAVAAVGGVSYLVVAAAGTGSLSVIELRAGGALRIADHALDDLTSRFAGVTALEVVTLNGRAYVIAGGADDGISLFQLLPGGRLLALAHLADTTAIGLANVSAIAAVASGGGIDIFVASSAEAGLTRLRFEPGAAGQTLTAPAGGGALTGGAAADILLGGAGPDRLAGGAGDDILIDGAGADTLTGGAGADVFVMSADGGADTITDFTPGVDRIDLSGWGMLRSLDQLTLTATATGLRIAFGDEVLLVRSAGGGPIDPAQLREADLFNLSRIPVALPNLPPEEPPPPPDNPHLGGTGADSLTGGAGADTLTGQAGNDTLLGQGGHDRIYGGTGADRLDGGAGNDLLEGGTGADSLAGGPGADSLYGGEDADTLTGGEDADSLYGGTGNDRLSGEAGNDLLEGGAGHDSLYGGAGADSLAGGDGNDALEGGAGPDSLYGGAGDDRLAGGEEADWLEGGAGNDRLTGGNGDDRLYGGDGRDALEAGMGNDSLYGGASGDRLTGGAGADLMDGGLGNDTYSVDSAADVILGELGFSQGGGIDTVESWISFTLAANLEILRLQGTADINGTGTWAPEALVGNAGRNVLDGSRGNDQINGKAGNDTIIGGRGADVLVGEGGADVFLFREAADSGLGQANRDLINGFEHGIDRIDLSRIDANPFQSGDQAFDFIGSARFGGQGAASAGEVRFTTWGGGNFNLVEIDINGDGQADMQIFVNQTGWMTGGDFIL
jgi:Ca2+-binding RTX toxin-like protein